MFTAEFLNFWFHTSLLCLFTMFLSIPLTQTGDQQKLRRRTRISLPLFLVLSQIRFPTAVNGGGDGEMRTMSTRFDCRRRNLCSTVTGHLPLSAAATRSVCRGGEDGRRGDGKEDVRSELFAVA